MKTGKWIRRWDVNSSSNRDYSYTVAQSDIGVWGCSCPHWKYRRLECKHIKMVKSECLNGTKADHYELDRILGLR